MVTIVETIRAVSDVLETVFGDAPTTKDITRGFDRPCTYLQMTNAETEKTGDARHDTYMFQIIRFAERTDVGYLSLLEDQGKLAEALEKPVVVEEFFFLYPENVSFELRRDEMVLLTSFSVQNFQVLPEEDAGAEDMETLNLSRKE